MTPATHRATPPRPTITSPMMRLASPTTTMPVPRLESLNFCCWASRPPDREMMALARQSPTVVVKAGLMEEAETMSLLSPVARMDRPSWVPRKAVRPPPTTSTTARASARVPNCLPSSPSAQVNTVSALSRGRFCRPPMTMRLMEYRPVMVTIPARMGCTLHLVCKKAVTPPAIAPARMAAASPSTGWPSVVSMAEVVRSATFSTR